MEVKHSGTIKREYILNDYTFLWKEAWGIFSFNHFTHKPASKSSKFLINKHPSLCHKGKVLKINNKMTFQAQTCILIHASQNQATFQRHCFNHFKNLIHYYKVHA